VGKCATEERSNRPNGVRENEKVEKLNANSIPMNLKKKTIADNKKENSCCWETLFRELLAHLQAHGDCNVPECYPHNPLLGRWVSEQRNAYGPKRRCEQTSLTPLREAKLDAIGFAWFVDGGSISSKYAPPEDVVSSAVVRPGEARSGSKEEVRNAPPEDVVSSAVVRPGEARSGNKEEVRSEIIGVASPDRITSGLF
jgi:hypothetical protein